MNGQESDEKVCEKVERRQFGSEERNAPLQEGHCEIGAWWERRQSEEPKAGNRYRTF
jgi:hypothetical protein